MLKIAVLNQKYVRAILIHSAPNCFHVIHFTYFKSHLSSLSSSTGDIGTLNTSHDMIKLMPKLNAQDVADAVLYVISTPENVLVMIHCKHKDVALHHSLHLSSFFSSIFRSTN
jgi:hypothetical protein